MTVTPTDKAGRRLGRATRRRAAEAVVRILIYAAGLLSIVILLAIAVFLFVEARRSIAEVGLGTMLSGTSWFPTGTPKIFGFLPLIAGSLSVTAVALVVFLPVGVGAAIFISESTAFSGWPC
jgi:ABC-type phosphate transport system permease subunit